MNAFPPDYLLNRIGGGAVTGLRGLFIGAEMKRRQLMPAVEASRVLPETPAV